MDQHPNTGDELNRIERNKALSNSPESEDQAAGYGQAVVELADANLAKGIGNYRWIICGLIFAATTINYVDRSVLATASPFLEKVFHWSKAEYSNINTAFAIAYAIGGLIAGYVIDRIGTRVGYSLYLLGWSFAAIGHAFVHSIFGFCVARIFLGVFEAGNFPAAIKTTAEWFPKKERSLATGIFNSGSNIGAILSPIVVPYIVLNYNWQAAFAATGIAGLIWVFFWIPIYSKPEDTKRLRQSELNHILSDPVEPKVKVPWVKILPHAQLWGYGIAKFLTDGVWWFWIFWSAPYLHDKYHVDIKSIGLPLIVIFNVATVGSVGGGYLSAFFARRGWTINLSRKTAMLICGALVIPVTIAPSLNNEWAVIWLISLACAAHQGWSANLYSVASDLFPKRAVGSVTGIGGLFAGIGQISVQFIAGRVPYLAMFVYAGCAYLVALLILHLCSPRFKPAQIDAENRDFPVVGAA